MDHISVLKRAWELLKHYRVLWLFGLILALTAVSLATHADYGIDANGMPYYTFPDQRGGRMLFELLSELLERGLSGSALQSAYEVGAFLISILAYVVIIVSPVVRYVSEAALIRMVDHHETTGEQLRFRQAWKLGWSREAWRLFLIDLVIFTLASFAVVLLLVLLIIPLRMRRPSESVSLVAFFSVIFVINVVSAFTRLLLRFFSRRCVLEKCGVVDTLDQGFAMVKRHWKDVGLMWLITTGIAIVWSVLLTPLAFLLIAAGVLAGDDYTLLVRGLVGLVMGNVSDWIVGAFTGIPILILLFAIVVTLLNGLKEAFLSSAWTLTYRELRALDRLGPPAEPEKPDLV